MAKVIIDSYGNIFNTAKETASFWGVRESSIVKYLKGQKDFLFAGKRTKSDVTDVYFAVVERDSSIVNRFSDLGQAIIEAENMAWRDQRGQGEYYN